MRMSALIGILFCLLLPGTEGRGPAINGDLTTNIDEEEPTGTVVSFSYTVTGTGLSYALGGADWAKFHIDGRGVITVTEVLDYEARQTSFSIKLKVTDSSNNRAQEYLTVNLNDINDNTPICLPNIIYSGAITENDRSNTIAAAVSCSDADGTSPNNDVDIVLFNPPAEFTLIGNNIVTTQTATDYETETAYRLVIHAVDKGTSPNTGTAIVNIQIQPLNEDGPEWKTFPGGYTIDEDSPPGKSIVRLLALDSDDGSDGVITYSLVSTVTDDLSPVAGMFSVNPISGQLSTISYVDRDGGIASYTVTVRATDGGSPPKTADTSVAINLKAINDNAPKFSLAMYTKTILETHTTAGARIITVSATDDDLPLTAATIKYSIESGDTGSRFIFYPRLPGVLKLKANVAIDLDTGTDPSIYNLRIIAKDGDTPEKTGTTYVTITVAAVNESPPVFETLTQPLPVREDIKIGSVITTVSATDRDTPSGETITFSIIHSTTNEDFVIDPNTGIIRNKNKLDFETTSEYRLTVIATDSAVPPKSATATVVINVVNVNEATPTCVSHYLSVNIEESAAQGDVVTTLPCTDADTSDRLIFTIRTRGMTVFSTDSTTKQLVLASSLDYATRHTYSLTIEVTDSTPPIRTATIKVKVFVIPVNQHSPTFQSSPYTVRMAENTAVGTSVQQITASDADIGLLHGTLRYSITAKKGDCPFIIDNSGLVTVSHSLDRETTAEHILIVSVADDAVGAKDSHTATTSVTVILNDCNDNPPIFNPTLYITSHKETAKAGTKLVTVTTTDEDTKANNNPVYTILSGDVDDIFEMSKTNLKLKSGKSMDYTSRQIHDLIIHVTDQGAPALTAQARIIINVLSVNSNPPVFSGGSTKLTDLSETTAIGTSIYQAVASDSDGGTHGVITYSIISGNEPSNPFGIESTTGKIIVWSLLDYDTEPNKYNLTVQAEDGGRLFKKMWIYIPLKNENDNVPNFSATIFNLRVDENVASGTSIAPALTASDGDAGPSGQLSYSIVGGDGIAAFSIDSTSGMISTANTIDYESKTMYTLVLKAVDAGTPVNSATCLVLISVNDLNDNTPMFSPVKVTIEIPESTIEGTSIIPVFAHDEDSSADQNNVITYSLTSLHFSVNPSTGEITTTSLLDRESAARHVLTVTAYDRTKGATGSLTGTTLVTVEVTDVNDNPPVIASTSYDLSISEALTPGHIIVGIVASDKDVGDNAKLSYTIQNGATNNDLTIESNAGIIQVANALDRERTDTYFLEIVVTDNGVTSLTASVTCSVTILDVNDNVPTFSQSSHTFSIAEQLPVNTRVGFLAASDADIGDNGKFQFEFVNFWVGNSNNFILNADTGEITTNSILDRELVNEYQVWCRVSDSGTPKLLSEINITISVTDANDNSPLFSSTVHTGTVRENSAVGTPILSLTVSDDDMGVNGDITLSINTTSTSGRKADTFFTVSSTTREITVKVPVDREVDALFVFQVIAVDGGTPPHTSSMSVSIDVADVNDNEPIFLPVFYNTEVAYTGECDSSITTLTATDKDFGSNSKLDYYLIPSEDVPLFAVDSAGVFSLTSTAAADTFYLIKVGVRDKGNPENDASTQASIRIDTFDPTTVVISFLLNINKAVFQEKQGIFLEQVQAIVREKYLFAIVHMWCIEEESGPAIQHVTRRRLLQSRDSVEVHVLMLSDDTTELAANIDKTKTILAATETLNLFTTASDGSSSPAIKGPEWDYFRIQTIKIYYRKTAPWAETTAGIALIFFIVAVSLLLIAVIVVVPWWIYRKRKTRPHSPVTHSPVDVDSHSRVGTNADKEGSQSSENKTSINRETTSVNENATSVKETATTIEYTATSVNETATHVKEYGTSVKEAPLSVKESGTSVKETATSVKENAVSVKERKTSLKFVTPGSALSRKTRTLPPVETTTDRHV